MHSSYPTANNTAVPENSLLQQAEKRFEITPQNRVVFIPVSKAQKSLKHFSCLAVKRKKKDFEI
jgi:hypothetical protein